MDFSQFEPLVSDERLEKVADKIRSEFGHTKLEKTEFVTFIQPPKKTQIRNQMGVVVPTWVPEMAVFAMLSPNPRKYAGVQNLKVMTSGTASLTDWRDADGIGGHYVSASYDPLHDIFRGVAREHLKTLTNLKEMI